MADAAPHGIDSADAAINAVLPPSSNGCSAGVPDVGNNSPATLMPVESRLSGYSPERAALPSIEEHPEGAKAPTAAQPAQAQEPAAPEQAPLPAGMTVMTSAEDGAGVVDADSSRSHTPVSVVGVATPDIMHPPSAVEALQRGHQPWHSAEAPARLLQTGVASSGSRDSSASVATESPEGPVVSEDRVADPAPVFGATPASAESSEGGGPAEGAPPDAAGGDLRPNTALPPPEAMPALKPGELFCAFRRFAHEVGALLSAVLWVPCSRGVNGFGFCCSVFRPSAAAFWLLP